MYRILALSLLLFISPARANVETLLQLVDYMGVDYPEAVRGGEIVNEFEYAEMVEFAGRIQSEITQLPGSDATLELTALAQGLAAAVDARVNGEEIGRQTQTIRQLLMASYDIVLTPKGLPDLNRAAQLYSENCAACHGERGMGDGPLARGMEPAPTDFHDSERALQRSLYGLYNTITLGVEGTTMPAWPGLDDQDRWALAFYTGGMIADANMLRAGESAWQWNPLNLNDAVTLSPTELAATRPEGAALALWLRHNPEVLFTDRSNPMTTARDKLTESLALYRTGDTSAAQDAAVTAYLEGFELLEAPLSNIDAALMRSAETAMMNFRNAIAKRESVETVQSRYEEALRMLDASAEALSGEAMSPAVAFSGSLIILLREGLEIILVLAAIITFLVKSGRQDALKYVHAGWSVALLAGIGTWAVSSYLFTISGATRELTEGYTALFAAAILLYVGYWMHRNANAKRWASYLHSQVQTALTKRTLWTLVLVSFLAVYREIFEIILFYQALWAQANAAAHDEIFYGAGVAILALAVVTWLIYRFGMRLPLKQFFSTTAILLVALAFIFTGKGIAALQEAGSISITPVPGPTIDLLGIYPNMQVLLMQAVVVALTIGVYLYDRRSRAA